MSRQCISFTVAVHLKISENLCRPSQLPPRYLKISTIQPTFPPSIAYKRHAEASCSLSTERVRDVTGSLLYIIGPKSIVVHRMLGLWVSSGSGTQEHSRRHSDVSWFRFLRPYIQQWVVLCIQENPNRGVTMKEKECLAGDRSVHATTHR